MRRKLALITGATSGIGKACAEVLAERGFDLILTGRRTERLVELCSRLKTAHSIEAAPLSFDLSQRAETEAALKSVEAKLQNLSVLINNAGLARGTDPMPSAQLDDWEAMLDTNIKGLLVVTRYCLPHFLKNNEGHIVNLGSVAGRWVYPGGGVYCATKFAVRALTEGLRLDLMGTQVRVTNIEPGMVETEFSEVRFQNTDLAKAVYKGMTPLEARDIAESVAWCLERPQRVNIQELVIFPTDQAAVGPNYVNRSKN